VLSQAEAFSAGEQLARQASSVLAFAWSGLTLIHGAGALLFAPCCAPRRARQPQSAEAVAASSGASFASEAGGGHEERANAGVAEHAFTAMTTPPANADVEGAAAVHARPLGLAHAHGHDFNAAQAHALAPAHVLSGSLPQPSAAREHAPNEPSVPTSPMPAVAASAAAAPRGGGVVRAEVRRRPAARVAPAPLGGPPGY
jgi:hypothetical protein